MIETLLLFAEVVVLGWAVWFARGTIRSHRAVEKQRSGIQAMTRFFLDEELQTASRLLAKIDRSRDHSVEIYAYAEKRDTDERKALQMLLNFFETIAVGIKNNIYDERIVKNCQGTIIVGTWHFAESFVKRLRKENQCDSFYEHLGNLVRELESEGVTPPAQLIDDRR